MSGLSEVSILMGQRAADIEKAREVFTSEIRGFVTGILTAVRRTRSDPWTSTRIRLDIPREIDNETKSSTDLRSHFAVGRVALRFKKGVTFQVVGEVRFGVEFDEVADIFTWQVSLVPAAKYQRIDDLVWAHWKEKIGANLPPGAAHQDKTNTVRFVSRAATAELTSEVAFNDVKNVLEFTMSAEGPVGNAVGLDFSAGDDASEGRTM
jgi:hypothetical protein